MKSLWKIMALIPLEKPEERVPTSSLDITGNPAGRIDTTQTKL